MDQPYSNELHIALLAVQRAAILTKRVISTVDKGVLEKDDLSTVTVGDFAAQALLISALHARFPTDSFVGEESAQALRENPKLLERVWDLVSSTHLTDDASEKLLQTPSSQEEMHRLIDLGGNGTGGSKGRIWVLDPIDGTATFEKGQQYAINLALLVDGVEALGVIGCPNLAPNSGPISEHKVDSTGNGCILSAVRGQGAYLRCMSTGAVAEGEKLPRHAENVQMENLRVTECTTSSSMILPMHKAICEKLGMTWPGTDLWSSLMKYVALVVGGCNVNIRIARKRSYKSCIWDHVGGHLLFQEVGGKITDLDGKDVDFGLGRRMGANWGLVCAPSNLHGRVLQVIRESFRQSTLIE